MTSRAVNPVKGAGITCAWDPGFSFPKLYKKTSTGAIQYWFICVYEDSDHSSAYIISTEYGQLDTDSPQTTYDTIYEGKNVGRANETSVHQQAIAEAMAKHEKQRKKGYIASLEAAKGGQTDEIIEGGVVPMLAQSFTKHGHKIKYPCYVQPKLDGIRCIAIVKEGKCTLWSRTRKPITGVPHIAREIERLYGGLNIILDGELYSHDLKKDFEKIVSMVRQDEPQPGHEIVQYHIYDIIDKAQFVDRYGFLADFFTSQKCNLQYLRLVETVLVNENEVGFWYEAFKNDGYEGAMLRNTDSLYVNKRSMDLQKVKEFEDAEFDIIGVEEGRGKLQGHAGSFLCRTTDGKEFLAKMSGDTARLKEYFENHKLWQGKQLTVKFQGLTGSNGVPRFPVGVAIRDYE
jgi:DNA ligase-1